MQAVKSVEMNCWESDGPRDRKGNLDRGILGVSGKLLQFGWVFVGEQMVESFGEQIDGVENCRSYEIQSSLTWPWCVISVWLSKIKSLYFNSYWILAFNSELFKWSFLENCHKAAMGHTRRATILFIIPCTGYLWVDGPLDWNRN